MLAKSAFSIEFMSPASSLCDSPISASTQIAKSTTAVHFTFSFAFSSKTKRINLSFYKYPKCLSVFGGF